ncbi:MAG TPA: hypothetical protein VLB07_09720, partial [Woeseiaceae bacterium]|nr:hypothetical protein [Woeseiaceae bacterium]
MRLRIAAVTIEKNRGVPSLRQSPPERHTIIVIPEGAATADAQLHGHRWMCRGVWSRSPHGNDAFHAVLEELGAPIPAQGLAALRWWGQTGARPAGWVSAADPVYLEARLDHLRLHPLDETLLGRDEREELFAYLQAQLGDAGRRFALVGGLGYLLAERAFSTAACAADGVESAEPQAYLPPAGASAEHDRLVGELQLLLHEAPMNRRREEQGYVPVNSIWFW